MTTPTPAGAQRPNAATSVPVARRPPVYLFFGEHEYLMPLARYGRPSPEAPSAGPAPALPSAPEPVEGGP